jgi:hypothetical protein
LFGLFFVVIFSLLFPDLLLSIFILLFQQLGSLLKFPIIQVDQEQILMQNFQLIDVVFIDILELYRLHHACRKVDSLRNHVVN